MRATYRRGMMVVLFGVKGMADILADETKEILEELCNMSASLYTLNELMWIINLKSNLRWGTSVEFEQQLLDEVRALKDKISEPLIKE